MKASNLPVYAKVLLVDDDWRQLELRAAIFNIAGFSVVTAREPAEALSLAARCKELDLAVVDYEMPGMNGATLAEHLKMRFPQLNVVLYSGAVAIPADDVQKVDTVIRKGEGVTVLLRHIWRVSADSRLHEIREPRPLLAGNRR